MARTTLLVENQKSINIHILDGAFDLGAPVMPGTSRKYEMPGAGRRAITVRWLGGEAKTENYAFETNQVWRLVVPNEGKPVLELATAKDRDANDD